MTTSTTLPADASTRTAAIVDAAAIAPSTALALAALSGAAWATGFPPFSWCIVPWMALVPLLVACAALPPRQAALAGMCWTATAAVGVAWFLPGMLSGYFGLGTPAAWIAAVVGVAGLHGLWVGAWAAWVSWLVRRRAADPLLVAAGWIACELARTRAALGGPWGLAATSQVPWTAMIQIADVGGAHAIGWLVAAVNALVAASIVPGLRGRQPRRAAAVIVVAVAGAALYGHWRLGQDFGDGEPVRVAVVQAGAPAVGASARAERLARHLALSRSVAADADLIVWPEHALDEYLEEATPTRDAVVGLSRETGADLLVGGAHYAASSAGTRYHNSAWLLRRGRVIARYDKQRLVPFAEDGRARWLPGASATAYVAGDGPVVLPSGRLRLGPLLCVEAMVPELARRAVAAGAEVLLNLSNDTWFGRPEPARQQLQIAALRAVETRRPLVRAAATGFSAVIDPRGRIVVESGFDTHEVLTATVRAGHTRTPYQRWGDVFAWLAIAAAVAASLRSLRAPHTTHPRRLA